MLKTCLYDNGVLNVRDLIRIGKTNNEIIAELLKCFTRRPANGFEAEEKRRNMPVHESMATIGG